MRRELLLLSVLDGYSGICVAPENIPTEIAPEGKLWL